MPITDEELERRHQVAEGGTKELYEELLAARRALVIAKKISDIGPILETNLYRMELEGCPRNELYLAVVHKRADGSGRVGPTWDLGEFAQDLEQLSSMMSTEEERLDLSAAGILSAFGPVRSDPV
jgi:hypothetical protein